MRQTMFENVTTFVWQNGRRYSAANLTTRLFRIWCSADSKSFVLIRLFCCSLRSVRSPPKTHGQQPDCFYFVFFAVVSSFAVIVGRCRRYIHMHANPCYWLRKLFRGDIHCMTMILIVSESFKPKSNSFESYHQRNLLGCRVGITLLQFVDMWGLILILSIEPFVVLAPKGIFLYWFQNK